MILFFRPEQFQKRFADDLVFFVFINAFDTDVAVQYRKVFHVQNEDWIWYIVEYGVVFFL